jgi:protoporphyrinogen oxidase
MDMLQPSPEIQEAAAQLQYRPLIMLGMATRRQSLLPVSYLYCLNRPYNRLAEMNRFSPSTSPEGENILTAEIPSSPAAEDWNASAETLFERCLPAIEQDGFLRRDEVLKLFLVKARHAYPVYRQGYHKHLQTVMNYLEKEKGVSTLGRTGEFRYQDSDQCMLRAFQKANELIQSLGRPVYANR